MAWAILLYFGAERCTGLAKTGLQRTFKNATAHSAKKQTLLKCYQNSVRRKGSELYCDQHREALPFIYKRLWQQHMLKELDKNYTVLGTAGQHLEVSLHLAWCRDDIPHNGMESCTHTTRPTALLWHKHTTHRSNSSELPDGTRWSCAGRGFGVGVYRGLIKTSQERVNY